MIRRALVASVFASVIALPLTGWAEDFVVNPEVFRKLSLAQQKLSDKQPQAAVERLLKLAEKKSLSAHERALVYQTLAFAYGSQEKFKLAIGAFETCLAQNALPEAARHDTMYNLGQLYLANQNASKGVAMLEDWLKDTNKDSREVRRMLVAGYVMQEKPKQALPHAKALIAQENPPSERSYQTLLGLYVQLNEWSQAGDLLLTMLEHWPSGKYFQSLSSVYLRRGDTKSSVAVLQIANAGGFLTDRKEILEVAQRLVARDVPVKAGLFLERAIAVKALVPDVEILELMGRAWMLGHQRDKAIVALAKAIDLNAGPDVVLLLGHLYLQEESWSKASQVLKAGYQSASDRQKKSEIAYLLGIVAFNTGEQKAARQWFESAKADPTVAKKVASWMRHL